MKITPINFAAFLEPQLLSFWESRKASHHSEIQIQRSHNFKLVHTNLTLYAITESNDSEVLCSLQIVEIPQQENNAALNCIIHLPGMKTPFPILMVFKSQRDTDFWVGRIIQRLKTLLNTQSREATAPARQPAAPSPEDVTGKPAKQEEEDPIEDEEIK